MEQQDHRSVLWTSLPIEDIQTINLSGAVEGWWYCGRVRILGRTWATGEWRQCGQGTSGEPEFKGRFHRWSRYNRTFGYVQTESADNANRRSVVGDTRPRV